MHLLEALAVRALVHGRVLLVGAHADAVQAAVLLVLAVVGAGDHRALDGLVGGAGAAAVHTFTHGFLPPSLFASGFVPGIVWHSRSFLCKLIFLQQYGPPQSVQIA